MHTKGTPAALSEVETRERRDPWGRPPVLEQEGDRLHVRSLGPDGVAGTSDDRVVPVPARAQLKHAPPS